MQAGAAEEVAEGYAEAEHGRGWGVWRSLLVVQPEETIDALEVVE